MDILSDVSETGLLTLKSRVVEAQKKKPVIEDAMAILCLERLRPLLPPEVRTRLLDRDPPSSLTRHIALRSRKYDAYAREFCQDNPSGLVVSLGSGFDTRYWRVSKAAWPYMEVDLPAVMTAKEQVLGDVVDYPLISGSVLDSEWMEKVESKQSENILFLAEGLFMYLPKPEVIGLFQRLAERFSHSYIVFEVVAEKYTRGVWKKMVESKMKRSARSAAGSAYQFGLSDAREIEQVAPNIRVLEEWSYLEDPDIQPRILGFFQNAKFLSRTQWTIKAALG